MFPLARLADQCGTYAALLLNTNSTKLYVFSAGSAQLQAKVRNKKGKRVSVGGWSQARYQRRVENLHTKHIKEVAGTVEQVVKDESIARLLVAGDAVAVPLLRDHLSPGTRELMMEVGGRVDSSGTKEQRGQVDESVIEALVTRNCSRKRRASALRCGSACSRRRGRVRVF